MGTIDDLSVRRVEVSYLAESSSADDRQRVKVVRAQALPGLAHGLSLHLAQLFPVGFFLLVGEAHLLSHGQKDSRQPGVEAQKEKESMRRDEENKKKNKRKNKHKKNRDNKSKNTQNRNRKTHHQYTLYKYTINNTWYTIPGMTHQ